MAPRKKRTAAPGADAAPPPPAATPGVEIAPPPPAPDHEEPGAGRPAAGAVVDPFPPNLRRIAIGGTTIRLDQDRASDEMRIQFGDGRPQDRPSDAVIALIRAQEVPEALMTAKERAAGQPVPWFKYRTDAETGAGSWRMWMRNHPQAARHKAEQVFNAVVDRVAAEHGAGRGR